MSVHKPTDSSVDDIDKQILDLLNDDARRPYSEIADKVGVSPPTVSDRVERLQEKGVIDQFTICQPPGVVTEDVPIEHLKRALTHLKASRVDGSIAWHPEDEEMFKSLKRAVERGEEDE